MRAKREHNVETQEATGTLKGKVGILDRNYENKTKRENIKHNVWNKAEHKVGTRSGNTGRKVATPDERWKLKTKSGNPRRKVETRNERWKYRMKSGNSRLKWELEMACGNTRRKMETEGSKWERRTEYGNTKRKSGKTRL